MTALFLTVLGFLAGAAPFSLWLTRLTGRGDLRRIGDGNPGAANAWRAGGWRVGAPALALDFLKGALPVAWAYYGARLVGPELVQVALAPVAGHAFSPFLGGRGGKALAVSFGIWCGLTLYEAPIVLGLFMLLCYGSLAVDGWSALLALLGLGAYLVARQVDFALLAVWAGNLALLAWNHRTALRQPIRARPRTPSWRGEDR